MSHPHTTDTEYAVNLQRTRSTFLFAREQLAAHAQPDRYHAIRAMRRWEPDLARGVPATDAPDAAPTNGSPRRRSRDPIGARCSLPPAVPEGSRS